MSRNQTKAEFEWQRKSNKVDKFTVGLILNATSRGSVCVCVYIYVGIVYICICVYV